MAGTIIFYLVIILFVYYACMIGWDLYVEKNKEAENNEQEEEIDISGEVNSFAATHISRKPIISEFPMQASKEEEDVEEVPAVHDEVQVTDDNIDDLIMTLGVIPDEIRYAEGNPTNFRQPVMTDFMSPDELVKIVQEKSKAGNSDLGDIIAEVHAA